MRIPLVLLPGLDGTGLLFADFVANLPPLIEPIIVRYPADVFLNYAELKALATKSLPEQRDFIILGESFSGPIAISIAASNPQRLIGLVLCCTFAKNPRPFLGKLWPFVRSFPIHAFSHSFLSGYFMGSFSSPRLVSALDEARACVAPDVFRGRLGAVCQIDFVPELKRVRVPILNLRASQDRIVPRRASESIERFGRSVRTIELEGPHYLLQACPSRAAVVITKFAQELGGHP